MRIGQSVKEMVSSPMKTPYLIDACGVVPTRMTQTFIHIYVAQKTGESRFAVAFKRSRLIDANSVATDSVRDVALIDVRFAERSYGKMDRLNGRRNFSELFLRLPVYPLGQMHEKFEVVPAHDPPFKQLQLVLWADFGVAVLKQLPSLSVKHTHCPFTHSVSGGHSLGQGGPISQFNPE